MGKFSSDQAFPDLDLLACHRNVNSYGVALAALGMLSTLATGLTVDGFGPVSDNAGGIAEMSGMEEEVKSLVGRKGKRNKLSEGTY